MNDELDGFSKEGLEFEGQKVNKAAFDCNSLQIDRGQCAELIVLIKNVENGHRRILVLKAGRFGSARNWYRLRYRQWRIRNSSLMTLYTNGI